MSAAIGLVLLGGAWGVFVASGGTIAAAEHCRRSVIKAGYYQEPVEWDAPATIRERIRIHNYERKKAYERLLASCDAVRGPPVIICGPLKCGGIFSSESESTAQRIAREEANRAAVRAETTARRRIEDQSRIDRVLRDDQEDVVKRLNRKPRD